MNTFHLAIVHGLPSDRHRSRPVSSSPRNRCRPEPSTSGSTPCNKNRGCTYFSTLKLLPPKPLHKFLFVDMLRQRPTPAQSEYSTFMVHLCMAGQSFIAFVTRQGFPGRSNWLINESCGKPWRGNLCMIRTAETNLIDSLVIYPRHSAQTLDVATIPFFWTTGVIITPPCFRSFEL